MQVLKKGNESRESQTLFRNGDRRGNNDTDTSAGESLPVSLTAMSDEPAPEETPAEMNAVETNDGDGPPVDPEEAEMMALMGFGGFGTTQGKQVEDANANVSAVHKKTTRRARQYMNRPGGFNRPLPEEQTGVKSNKI